MNFPYFTAAAWYHEQLNDELQQKDLEEILPESEAFTLNELLPALARGASLTVEEKVALAEKMAHYSGISEELILQANLDLTTSFFWKELMRSTNGKTIGRLDSRYLGLDKTELGTRPEYNPELNAWLQAFTPAINHYMREHLNFQTDTQYNMFGSVHPWDRTNNNTRDNLRKAMAHNPNLHILFQAGYYDGATTYFNSKYTLWQIDPSGKMKDRMHFEAYRSGHMMYLRKEDLSTANEHIRSFIETSYVPGKPAKHGK